jgi:hypothetical protein
MYFCLPCSLPSSCPQIPFVLILFEKNFLVIL